MKKTSLLLGCTGLSILFLLSTGCATLERHSSFPDARIRRGESQPNQIFPRDKTTVQAPQSEQTDDTGQTFASTSFGTGGVFTAPDGYGREFEVKTAGLPPERSKIVAAALSLLGKNNLQFGDRAFPLDCTGVIMAAYYAAGNDLTAEFTKYTGNGVQRLYEMAAANRQAYKNRLPSPGDVIIWDNTYDRDGNKRWDDEYTHTGIVVGVDPDGQITYVHHNYAQGIVAARMNLNQENIYLDDSPAESPTLVNSPMRMKSDRYINPDKWLSSHLFRVYAGLPEILN